MPVIQISSPKRVHRYSQSGSVRHPLTGKFEAERYVPSHARARVFGWRLCGRRPRHLEPQLGIAYGHARAVHVPIYDAAPEQVLVTDEMEDAALVAPAREYGFRKR